MRLKRNIICDLDETLIHSVVMAEPNPALAQRADFQFKLDGHYYYVFKRPGLDAFLQTIFKDADYIGFWTTGMASYAKQILKNILTLDQANNRKLVFIFTRNKCSHDQYGYYKPLTTVYKQYSKFSPKDTIMIDNTAGVMRKNPENGIVCPDFNTTNVNTDWYLPWLQKQMQENMHRETPGKFIKRVNSLS